MRTSSVDDFQEQCGQLLADLPADGITIAKNGRPFAKLAPIRLAPWHLIGSIPNMVVDKNDDLFSTGIRWEAEIPERET